MRVIFKYALEDRVKYISHLDLMRVMQRAARRGNVPIAFSQGFNPHPIMAFASALSVGVTSSAEYMDIELEQTVDTAELVNRFNSALPKGIRILEAVAVNGPLPSLMSLIDRADYEVFVDAEGIDFSQRLDEFLKQPEVLVEKKGKKGISEINLMDMIIEISIHEQNKQILLLKLCSGSRGNIKPEIVVIEFLRFLGIDNPDSLPMDIHRTGLFAKRDDKWNTPLELIEGRVQS